MRQHLWLLPALLMLFVASCKTEKTHSYPAESADAVCATPDGGFIAAGGNNPGGRLAERIWAGRFDADGNPRWIHTYNAGPSCRASAIQISPDGGALFLGIRNENNNLFHVYLLKVDSSGEPQWNRTVSSCMDLVFQAVSSLDGGFVLTGGSGNYPWKATLLKVSAEGEVTFCRQYGDTLCGIAATSCADGGFLIAANAYAEPYMPPFTLIRTNPAGDSLWSKQVDDDISCVTSLKPDSGGGYVLLGEDHENYPARWRLDANGSTVSTYRNTGCWSTMAVDGVVTPDGGFALVGVFIAFEMPIEPPIVIKLSDGNTTAWTYTCSNPVPYSQSICLLNDGGLVLASCKYTAEDGKENVNQDVYLIKLSQTGALLWERTFGD